MQTNETRESMGDRQRLSFDDRKILEERVIPTARRWIEKYPPHSNMWGHAMKTLAYWGEA